MNAHADITAIVERASKATLSKMAIEVLSPGTAICKELVQNASEATGLTEEVIMGRGRTAEVARVRFVVWYELQTKYGYSLSRIGKLFRRDHTTIMSGINKIAPEMEAQ